MPMAWALFFVCPDGGFGSWYLDSPVDTAFRYETFVTAELVPYIDASYPRWPTASTGPLPA